MKRNKIVDAIIDSELIEPGTSIILGFSGGPDSLCLLHALSGIADAYNYEIIPVHINHHLRPEADEEADRVYDMCERLDLYPRVYDTDCALVAEETGTSVEEAGRIIRYQIFDEVFEDLIAEGRRADRIVIALAHNADDQCETVLFRLMRGTGPHGLSGIPAYRMTGKGCPIVRPLLNVERRDIEEYIRDNKLKPNIDKSNKDNRYTRNRIRNELIPYLEENYNPNIKAALRRYALLANIDDSFLRRIAFSDYTDYLEIDEKQGKAVLDITKIRDNPASVNSRVISYIFELFDLESIATFENTAAILDLIYGDSPSAGIDLATGIRVHREYDNLVFTENEDIVTADESLTLNPHIVMMKDFHPDEEKPYAAFDFDRFNEAHPGRIGDIELRTRREGDFLPIKDGRKKIQDLLVDSKVKRNARDAVMMACIGSEVLWVLPGEFFSGARERQKGKFSSEYHISNATERVLLIEIEDSI